jgi:uncharacterized protein
MQCPNDGTTLQMTSRDGIEIDYCPQCRGVWLDRGELDKIIERSSGGGYAPSQSRPTYDQRDRRDYDDDDEDHRYDSRSHDRTDHGQHGHKKKKEGFLGDLFDF